MSNVELNAGHRQSDDAHDSPDRWNGHDELKNLIDAIATQLTDADRRHTATLGEMQDRIADMGRETETLRDHIPDELAHAFARIESGVAELAKRLSAADDATPEFHNSQVKSSRPASPMALRGAAAVDTFDVIGSDAPDHDDPWDRESADALTGVYESGAADLVGKASSAGTRRGIDQAWLENRFAEIAKGIEQSLDEIRPDRGFHAIGQRLDQFEQQFSKMFEDVATRSDLGAVRLIEAHVGEVVNHLVQTHDQLMRLSVIEEQLASITHTLEVQDGAGSAATGAGSSALDVGAIARAAAEHAALRFADMTPTVNDSASELRPLIERMMSENRHGDENTVALLDTLQQAMIRLLDRVDAIEFAQHHNAATQPVSQSHAQEGPRFGTEAQIYSIPGNGDTTHGYGASMGAYTPADVTPTPRPQPVQAYESSEPRQSSPRNNEKLRQDFIAEARRAKMRLAAAAEDEIIITSPAESGAFSMSSSEVGRGAHGSRPIRPPASTPKATGPSGPSPRLVVLGVAALLALSGLWYTLGTASHKSTAPLAPTASSAKPAVANEVPEAAKSQSGTAGQPASAPDGADRSDMGPRGEATPQEDQRGKVIPSEAHAAKTTLPMLGVAVDINEPVTEATMKQAKRHEAMATLSGELGEAAARSNNAAIVPASMVPTEAETEVSSGPGNAGDIPSNASRSEPLDMPAATVGPLSLRLAAANGDPSAQFEVGARLAEGKGTPQNFKDAAKWYNRSADHGFAPAQYRLGTLYERGLGLKPDRALAAAWYRRAAVQGNIKAMHNLAVLSANQTDKSPDYTTAAQWFEQAAKRGLADSQFNLAVLYENGLGVKRDLKQAYMWVSLAARNKDADAVRRRDILRGKLTADEMVAAEQMIAAWKPIPFDRTVNDARTAGEAWKQNPKNGVNG
ncbi:MAG TPA: sel1 repeat family protein [Hyphomicrobium sp.]